MVVINWSMIIASFLLVIWQPTIWAVGIALIVLGGRHLGLGILMHECAHRSLTNSRPLNDWIGQWLCAAPAFADLEIYRTYHMTHHVKTGTEEDPDLPNYSGYPVTGASFARKILRDLSGITGLKVWASLAVLYSFKDPQKLKFGYAYKKQTADSETAALDKQEMPARSLANLLWNTRRVIIVNILGFGVLWAIGHPLAYILWPVSWLTTYMVFSRIRNAAEHGGLPGTMTTDIWSNTRTIIARWWERLTVAPNYVNFHLEHHIVPTVPAFQLKKMHQYLKASGALDKAQTAHGYTEIVRTLISAKA